MEDNTQESGVESSESTSSSESASPAQTPNEVSGQDVNSQVEKPAPFHEHPRFKELIEQNRTYRDQVSQYNRSVEDLRRQMSEMQKASQAQNQPKQPSYDTVLNRLKDIDPEFAKLQEEMYKEVQEARQLKEQFQELRGWKDQVASQQMASEANSTLENLYTSNKISQEDRGRYDRFIKATVYELESRGQRLTPKDLPGIFNEVHAAEKAYQDQFSRKVKESYVAEKKKDATPASQTGGAPAGVPVQQMDKQSAIKSIAQELARGRQTV